MQEGRHSQGLRGGEGHEPAFRGAKPAFREPAFRGAVGRSDSSAPRPVGGPALPAACLRHFLTWGSKAVWPQATYPRLCAWFPCL